jgi:AAA family ATP:ADP antiporter
MADRFTLEQSKRFFAVIAVGGTLGAIFGPWLATVLVERIGTANLLLVSAGFLVLAIGFAATVARLQPAATPVYGAPGVDSQQAGDTVGAVTIGGSAWEGFRAVFRSRYLMGIAGFLLIVAVMATFIYFTRLQMVAELGIDTDAQTAMFARMDFITQLATLATQLVLTGHLMKRLGVPLTLALLPITTVLGFVGLAVLGSFASLVVFQAAFNAVQRGIMRPARETLFTIVSREDKYKSKAFIDTAVYRAGDSVTAWLEGGISRLGGLIALASFAVPLAVVWCGLAVWLGREQERDVERRAVPEMVGT